MDEAMSRRLARLTSDFYARTAPSFSATRQSPWQGWHRVLEMAHVPKERQFRVLDLAAGNLRFERFLADELEGAGICAWAFDSCDALLGGGSTGGADARVVHLDIAEALFSDEGLAHAIDAPACDLCVCFGFMHHLALPKHRTRVLEALLAHTASGGCAAVSFWQLSNSEKLLAKAREVTAARAGELGVEGLERGDYLLGWQGETDPVRYCHDFSEAEVDELVASVSHLGVEAARFSADGRSGDLNRYVVMRRA